MKPTWIAVAASAVLGALACSTPVPKLQFGITKMSSQVCPSDSCMGVSLPCPTILSIKIVDPSDPTHPYLQQCLPVVANTKNDICSLAGVTLGGAPIPVKRVQVQAALFASTDVPMDDAGVWQCPDVLYSDATGLPVEQATPGYAVPAAGGSVWYNPGDQVVELDLGCTDLPAITQSCMPDDLVQVTTQVESFATGVALLNGDSTIDDLAVMVGEPHQVETQYTLDTTSLHALSPQMGQDGDPASWSADLELPLEQYACINVLENAAQATATVTCQIKSNPINALGAWMEKRELDEILLALSLATFPDAGLTVGIVVDEDGRPIAGATVTTPAKATVLYLSDDRMTLQQGATMTSSSGVFVSPDAPFPTQFMVSQGDDQPVLVEVGGLIQDKVTVVVLGPRGA